MNRKRSRRRHDRVDAILHVEYGKHAYAMESATTGNASPGGLFILTNNPLRKGLKILVHLFVPDVDGPETPMDIPAALSVEGARVCYDGQSGGYRRPVDKSLAK